MAVSITQMAITAEEFARLPEANGKQELVRGEVIVQMPPSEEHGDLQLELGARMRVYAKEHALGRVVTEVSFCLQANPDTVRLPDVAFIRAERLPPGGPRRESIPDAPDIAVEVISPGDTLMDLDEKVQEYLSAGAQLVWVVNPRTRSIRVHYPDGSARALRGAEVLSGEQVLPGFSVRVDELFAG